MKTNTRSITPAPFAAPRTRRRWLWALPAVASFALAMPNARATDLPVRGGAGGVPFRSECSGDYVAGLYVRSGAWIDAIGLKCARYDRLALVFARPAWNKPYNGGTGVGLRTQEKLCPPDSSVTAIRFGYTRDGSTPKFIDHVQFECRTINGALRSVECVESGDGCWLFHPSPGTNLPAFSQSCPEGQMATGIRGRAGIYVDAVGLVCGARPKAPNVLVNKATTTPPPRSVIARNDVDVHAGPGGESAIIGIMRAAASAIVIERHDDGWCHLRGVAGGADGWVAEDHLQPDRCGL